MDKQKQIENLVSELDSRFSKGVGHVNFTTENGIESITTNNNFTECADGKNACGVPTIYFDEDE